MDNLAGIGSGCFNINSRVFSRYKHTPMPRIAFAATLLLLAQSITAQRITTSNSHVWVSYLGDYQMAKRWSIHVEGHWRRAELGQTWQQLLLRPALNFQLNPNVLFTLGGSYYYNYRYGDYPIRMGNWEYHVFEQAQLKNSIGRLMVQNRFRLEQRYIAQLKATPDNPLQYTLDRYDYRTRCRYRVLLSLPLNHPKLDPDTWFLSAYNEVFLSVGDPARLDFIQQNRMSALLGYQFNKNGSIQVGYLFQNIQRPGAANGADLIEYNNTLHVIFTYNLSFVTAL
jgi:Protein of unknown function (DUF2490)